MIGNLLSSLYVASGEVSNSALSRACYVLRFLLADRSDLRRVYYKAGGRVVVVGRRETLADIPEYRRVGIEQLVLPADDAGSSSPRGLAAVSAVPVTSAPEENLLCGGSALHHQSAWNSESNDDVLLKTLAIGLLNVASERGFGRPPVLQTDQQQQQQGLGGADEQGYESSVGLLKDELNVIYRHAMRSGWWRRTNAARDPDSYFVRSPYLSILNATLLPIKS